MTKNEIKERVNEIVNVYCILFDSLCKSNRNNAFIYYHDYINKISGIFTLLAYDSPLPIYEFNKFHNECLAKLELIYDKYK